MKKTAIARLGVMALALSMVTTSLVGGTLAKYTSEFTGTGTGAYIAQWMVMVDSEVGSTAVETFDFDLVEDTYTNVTEGYIAPGVGGYFAIDVINMSNVDATITASFTADNVPTNVSFYEANDEGDAADTSAKLTATDGGVYTITDLKLNMYDGTTTDGTIKVFWVWDYEDTADATTYDAADTAIGIDTNIAGGTMDVEVTVTATQDAPAAAD